MHDSVSRRGPRVAGDRVNDIVDLIRRIVADVDAADSLPDRWTVDDGPFIVVESDGTPINARSHTVQMIRVRVHALDRPTAYELMDRLDALLLAHSRSGVGFRISEGQNLLVERDSKAGGYVAGAGYSVTAEKKGLI